MINTIYDKVIKNFIICCLHRIKLVFGDGVESSGTVTQPVGRVPTPFNCVNRVPAFLASEDIKAVIGRLITRSEGGRRASCILTFRPNFFLS